jgi:hypothetical protein
MLIVCDLRVLSRLTAMSPRSVSNSLHFFGRSSTVCRQVRLAAGANPLADDVDRHAGCVIADLLGSYQPYHAVRGLPGLRPVLAAVAVAEIGDISRFPSRVTCAAGPG